MLVAKEDIEKAKEKLGDDNAFIVADLLGLEDFDDKNFKACCPYHNEKTASFIYNRKEHYWKCFGCGKSVDLIDVLMENGNTFLDAAKFLFDRANMEYSFGEQNVKTKRDYRYPHEEPMSERRHVIEYLGKRGISKSVIDYLDIREDMNGNCVFNYYDENDVLTMVKYRPSHTVTKDSKMSKTWCQKDSDTSPILFNMNRVNTSKTLLVVEGEIDLASVIEAGYTNAVSIPLGAQNLHWIEECWDWLNGFDSIIVWSDNDEPGVKMRKECIYRLGSWRTKYISTPPYYINSNNRKIPTKDINECLQVGGKDYVMKLISTAKDVPVEGVIDYSDIEELDVSQMDGVKTGIKPLDKELIKIFYGTLTILSGRPGSGKTSILDQIIASTIDQGQKVFLFSKEMPERMSANWFNIILAGRRNLVEKTNSDGESYYVVPYSIQKEMQSYYKNKLFIYQDSAPNDVTSVLRTAEECVRKFGCKLIVLDNLMMIDLHCSENERNLAQTNFINKLINFATKFNVAIILVSHPRKVQDNNADIEMFDIAGTSNIINLATVSWALRRVSKKEKEDAKSKWGRYDVVLTILKDRLLGRADAQIGLWYNRETRRFYTDKESLYHNYGWDKKEYKDDLPYVDRLEDIDDFPDQ